MSNGAVALGVFVVGLIFNAGGFYYLTRAFGNKLDAILSRQSAQGERIARIEGALRLPGRLTEN